MVSVNLKEWPNGKPLDEQQARHVQAMEIVKNEYRKRIKLD